MDFHVEVDFSGFPFFAGFGQQGGDQPQEGRFVGKEAGDTGAAFDFLIHPFQRIGGAHSFLVGQWQGEDREAQRQVVLHPGGQFGRALGVVRDEFLEPQFGGGAAEALKDAADGPGDFGALIQSRDMGLGVLLEMELATLPGHGGKDRRAGGLETGVIVAGDVGNAAQAALQEALEEGAPVDLRFAQGDADAQEGTFAIDTNPHGDQDGAVEQLAALTNLFVAGIQEQIGKVAEGPVAPGLQFGVQELGARADLGGTDAGAAEFLDDGGDFAGGDALDIHFGHGQFERLLGTEAFFQGAGIEGGFAPDLRHAEGDGADAAGERLGFVTVGVALAGVGAFVGLGLEDLMAFDAHRFVDEQADAFGEAGGALLSEQLQDVVQEIRIGGVGHVVEMLAVFADTPTGNQYGPPSTSFARVERLHPSGVRLRSARYARLRSAEPRRGEGAGKKDKLQKEFYTGNLWCVPWRRIM